MDKTLRRNCQTQGCKEYGVSTFHNAKERREIERRPWYCTRHSNPDDVLSASNRVRETEYTLSKVYSEVFKQMSPGLYWVSPTDKLTSGFVYGPGFKAFQEDFPEGTKILVRAEVVLPHEPTTDYVYYGSGAGNAPELHPAPEAKGKIKGEDYAESLNCETAHVSDDTLNDLYAEKRRIDKKYADQRARQEFTERQKVIFQGKVYDFGYYTTREGYCVLYKEGEMNMQDSVLVPVYNVTAVNSHQALVDALKALLARVDEYGHGWDIEILSHSSVRAARAALAAVGEG